jgi:hypothetical protein
LDVPHLEALKDCYMKKKLLVLLIAAIPMLMPNLASAVAIFIDENHNTRALFPRCLPTSDKLLIGS